MFTRRFYIHCLSILGLFFLNHLGKWPFLQSVIIFMLALPVISLLFGLYLNHRLKLVYNDAESLVEIDEVASCDFYIRNPSKLFNVRIEAGLKPSPLYHESGEVRRYGLLLRDSESKLSYEEIARHCGPLELGMLELFSLDPAGFFRFKLGQDVSLAEVLKIFVLPAKKLFKKQLDEAEQELEEGSFNSKKSISEISEIDRMRPMQAGDRLRSIHWKLSARMSDWMVKQYERAEEREIVFLFDLPRPSEVNLRLKEESLYLRDSILEHANYLMEQFLVEDFVVKLKLPGISPDEYTAKTHSDAEFLRQALAKIPWRPNDSLTLKLKGELTVAERKLFYIACQYLDPEVSGLISLLARDNISCIVAYYGAEDLAEEQLQLLEELRLANCRVLLFDQYGQELGDGRL